MRVRGQDTGATVTSGREAASSTPKRRGRPPKDKSSTNKQAPKPQGKGKRAFNLTVFRVARIISRLGNKRGSSLNSIHGKLKRDGHEFKQSQVRQAVERAINHGVLKEVKEERYRVPRGAPSTAPSTSNAEPAATTSQGSAAGSKGKRRQRPGPRQGRRAKTGVQEEVEALITAASEDQEDEAPAQDAPAPEAASAGLEAGEQMETKSVVTEPVFSGSTVTGCDAVPVGNKVFGL